MGATGGALNFCFLPFLRSQRVAAAWSRSNFPPKVLDTMFRAVEAVYRINKSLLAVRLPSLSPLPQPLSTFPS